MAFYVGKSCRIANWAGALANPSGGFRDVNGLLYDPSVPSCKYRLPGGTTQTVSGGSLTKDGVGLYSLTITPNTAGDAIALYSSSDGALSDAVTWKIEASPL